VRNEAGMYDLIEVKSKTAPRKKTIAAQLLDSIVYDASFQAYVLAQACPQFSGSVLLYYLNKEYVKQ